MKIRMKKSHRAILRRKYFGSESTALEHLQFNLATIEAATNKFSNENSLGRGGFGQVFKGILSNGQEIAVKRLSTGSSQGADEFKNEVLLIARLQHRNLVALLGFCVEEQEKLLVYEYVLNRSLDYFLFEYAMFGQYSEKSDVFSFGVIVLEIISGRKNTGCDDSQYASGLLSYTWKKWRDDKLVEVLDSNLTELGSYNEVIKCIQIGLLCVQENPNTRPSMSRVVSYLNNDFIQLPLPKEPAFFLHGEPQPITANESGESCSINEASVSEFFPR
ncbi:hypothetical protein K1719_016594 [Acacia pycnantha]|nr:hypothetical protein K1719_016594 [Acacia pycnantha]